MTKRILRTLLLLIFACSFAGTLAHAQALHATPPLPSFEVATIKPNDPTVLFAITPPGMQEVMHAGGFTRGLIAQAYRVPIKRILGGPDWIDKKIYRVEGKIPADLFTRMQSMPPEEKQRQGSLMMQSLLAERFNLKVHFETKEIPVYELVVTKDGLKIPKNKDDDPAPFDAGMVLLKQGVRAGVQNATMTAFAAAMSPMLVDRPVIDKTGITGRYTFRIMISPDGTAFSGMHAKDATEEDITAPSIFTVLQDLGLKLVPSKGPVEMVVIDSIDPPSEN